LYFDVLPEEDVKYILKSNESELKVICAFVDEKLRSLRIYVNDGSPLTTKPATTPIEMAKDFLEKYPTYSDGSYYSTMRSMLDNVEGDRSITKTFENIKLEVTVTTDRIDFRWKYVFNGVEAPSKCVVLNFEQGFLKYFIDKWSLCTIGSTDLNISEEEAIEIAMNAAENHSWNVGTGGDNSQVTVTEFNIVGVSETTLSFGNYPTKNESRGGNPLTFYPGWRVKLYFDKLYPGGVYGLDIAIWADTGEVNDIRELLSGLPPTDFPSPENLDDIEGPVEQPSDEPTDSTDPDLTPFPANGNLTDNNDSVEQPLGDEYNDSTNSDLTHLPPNRETADNADSVEQTLGNESNDDGGPDLTPIMWIALPLSIGIALGATIVCSKRKKKISHKLNSE
jgi:hypothetical protein